jgi:hypothetical protein
MAAKKPDQVDLAAEERRSRVERVQKVAGAELAQLEAALLDAQARIPTLISLVQTARGTIKANTAPVKADAE